MGSCFDTKDEVENGFRLLSIFSKCKSGKSFCEFSHFSEIAFFVQFSLLTIETILPGF